MRFVVSVLRRRLNCSSFHGVKFTPWDSTASLSHGRSHSTTTRQIIREIKITRDLWHERMINEQLRQVLHSHLENFKLTSTNQTGWVQYLEIPKTFLRGVECLQWADRDQLVALFKQFKYQILNALIDLTRRDSYEIITKRRKTYVASGWLSLWCYQRCPEAAPEDESKENSVVTKKDNTSRSTDPMASMTIFQWISKSFQLN